MNKPRTISPEEIRAQYDYMQKVRDFWGGRQLYVYIETFGCQQNEADSQRLCGMAAEMGYTPTGDPVLADLILINTCAVREHAELKALSITGQFKHLKEKKPSLQIGICGCMVSQEHRKEDVRRKYPYVNFLFGTSMLWRFPQILWEALHAKRRTFHLDIGDPGNIAEGLPIHRDSPHKAWVSIMYGCNNFCTYCVVPYVRGRERSRRPECVLEEVRTLAAAGYREITLLGQNVNSYGKDLEGSYDFADLLTDICKIEGDFQVRFMTSHPKDASEKLIDVMAGEEKIAKAFHLPLQSGSDNILRAMNRVYDRARYLHLVDYMRQKMPNIAITTDIIVGFPGETEEDFEGTLDMLRRVRYDNIYSFLYSPRKGTPAAEMPPVPQEVKAERFQRLLDTQYEIAAATVAALVGSVQEVLVEGISKTDGSRLTGRTAQNRLVHFEGDEALIGKAAKIRISRAEPHALFGELVD